MGKMQLKKKQQKSHFAGEFDNGKLNAICIILLGLKKKLE